MAKATRRNGGPEAFVVLLDRLYHAMTAALGARDRVAWLQEQGASAVKVDAAADDAYTQFVMVLALARSLPRDIGRRELAQAIATIEAQADSAVAAQR